AKMPEIITEPTPINIEPIVSVNNDCPESGKSNGEIPNQVLCVINSGRLNCFINDPIINDTIPALLTLIKAIVVLLKPSVV
ncbi:2053_t:CDS:1, partial [Dentiscutata heterogama]